MATDAESSDQEGDSEPPLVLNSKPVRIEPPKVVEPAAQPSTLTSTQRTQQASKYTASYLQGIETGGSNADEMHLQMHSHPHLHLHSHSSNVSSSSSSSSSASSPSTSSSSSANRGARSFRYANTPSGASRNSSTQKVRYVQPSNPQQQQRNGNASDNIIHSRGAPRPSSSSWNFLRLIYKGDLTKAFHVVESGQYQPSEADLNEILTSLSRGRKLSVAIRVIEEARKWGLVPPVSIKSGTIMIDVYGKARLLDRAFMVFDHLMKRKIKPNAITYNALISACARSVNVDLAFKVFSVMRAKNIPSDKFTYGALIDACAKAGHVEHAFRIADLMSEEGVPKDQTVYSALIDACGRAGAVNRAFLVYEEMKRVGVFPNLVTFAVLIDCCGDALLAEKAFEVFREIKHWGLTPNVISYTSLIDACAKVGWPERAELVFDDMLCNGVKPNEVTFGALIDAWIRVGEFNRAVGVFNCMVSYNIIPAPSLGFALLRLTRKVGALEDAFKVLLTMANLGIMPPLTNHPQLIRMVSILAVQRRLKDIKSDPAEPSSEDENVEKGTEVDGPVSYTLRQRAERITKNSMALLKSRKEGVEEIYPNDAETTSALDDELESSMYNTVPTTDDQAPTPLEYALWLAKVNVSQSPSNRAKVRAALNTVLEAADETQDGPAAERCEQLMKIFDDLAEA